MAQLTGTLIEHLAARARGPAGDAFLQKRHGVWRRHAWPQVWAEVQALAAGLRAAGLLPGESVAVISGARVEAVFAVYACQAAGLRPVLLNPHVAPGAVATFFQDAGCVAIVAEDQEQVDKVADVQSRLAALRRVWVIDAKGVAAYRHIEARPLAELIRAAPPLPETPPADAVALFTAGVYGEPRLVSVGHATVLQATGARQALDLHAGDRCVSLFGLSDALGFFFSVAAPLLYGTVPCFGEDRLPSVPEMRQCAPAVVASPARLLDRLRRESAARANRTGGLRERLIRRWSANAQPDALLRTLVGQPLANGLGLGACRVVLCGYGRMSAVTARFLARLGVKTVGLYGLAEAAGPVGLFREAAGAALSLFGPVAPVVSAERLLSVTVSGCPVATGDLVTLDGGALHLVGRAADLLTLADGQCLAPGVIEDELMASPYVNQAVAVGGPAGGVSALIELDEVTLRDWARAHGLAFTTLRSFAESSEVRRLIEQAVHEANQRLPAAARIVAKVLLPRALDPANGELSPALALRRAMVRNRYAHKLTGASS